MNVREFLIRLLPGLLAVVLIQSLAIAFFNTPTDGDTAEYLQLGKNVHDSGVLSFDGISPSRMRQPLYPIFLSLTYYSLGESFLVVKLFHALAGIISFVLISILYIKLCGPERLRLAAFVIGCYVPLWWNCAVVLSEPLAIPLTTGFLLCLYSTAVHWSAGRCVAAGVLLGLAVLTRPISIALLLMIWVPIALFEGFAGKRLRSLIWVTLGCVVILAPWAARNYYSCGTLTPLSVEGEFHALQAANVAAELPKDQVVDWGILRDSLQNKQLIGTFLEQLRQHPLSYLWNGAKRVVGTWVYFPGSRNLFEYLPARIASYTAQTVFLLLAALGFSRIAASRRWFMLYPAITFSIVIFFSSEGISRLLLPILPPILIAVVIGILAIADTAKSKFLKLHS